MARISPQTAERINEHKRIIRFRHVLVHGYDTIDYDVIWTVVENKLPALKRELEVLLAESEDLQ